MTASALKAWADTVKLRDGRCMDCGKGADLHAHHVKPRSTHPELSLDPANGRALCYSCHKAEHERHRPPRVRSNRPQRRTLNREIDQLNKRIVELETKNRELAKLAKLCARGCCQSGFELSRLRQGPLR